MSPVEEIKSRLDLVELISGYIQLKPAGVNFKAVCPFHKEKSPSFMVSKEKQIWHCFGCGEGGDLFGFVMKMEGLEFPEVLKQLAERAGVKLPKREPQQVQDKRQKFLEINEVAARFFHQLLLKHPKAQIARDYVARRHLKPDTTSAWEIGYSPDSWEALGDFLRQRGYGAEEIFGAGLFVRKENGQGFYDRFRHRLMFPIRDVSGRVCGFTARVLDETRDKMGKYINTPQTAIYDKSAILFGLDKAKTAIRKQNLAVLVEGNMDCITSHEAGVTNVVASSGTALTVPQVALIKRFTENVALAFDADAAGQNAALKGIEVAQSAGLNIKVITLPSGKDPDECIRNNPLDWLAAINQAEPIMEYFFRKTLTVLDLTKAENKKNAAKFLLIKISKLQDRVETAHYVQKLSQSINVPERILYESITPASRSQPQSATIRVQPHRDRLLVLSERFLALILKLKPFEPLEKVQPEMLFDGIGQTLYKDIKNYYNQNGSSTKDSNLFWQNWETNLSDEKLRRYHDQLILFLDKEFEPETDLNLELKATIFELIKRFLVDQSEKLSILLNQAELEGNQERINLLSQQFNKITENLAALDSSN